MQKKGPTRRLVLFFKTTAVLNNRDYKLVRVGVAEPHRYRGAVLLASRISHGQLEDVIPQKSSELHSGYGLSLIDNRCTRAQRFPEVGQRTACGIGRLRSVEV